MLRWHSVCGPSPPEPWAAAVGSSPEERSMRSMSRSRKRGDGRAGRGVPRTALGIVISTAILVTSGLATPQPAAAYKGDTHVNVANEALALYVKALGPGANPEIADFGGSIGAGAGRRRPPGSRLCLRGAPGCCSGSTQVRGLAGRGRARRAGLLCPQQPRLGARRSGALRLRRADGDRSGGRHRLARTARGRGRPRPYRDEWPRLGALARRPGRDRRRAMPRCPGSPAHGEPHASRGRQPNGVAIRRN